MNVSLSYSLHNIHRDGPRFTWLVMSRDNDTFTFFRQRFQFWVVPFMVFPPFFLKGDLNKCTLWNLLEFTHKISLYSKIVYFVSEKCQWPEIQLMIETLESDLYKTILKNIGSSRLLGTPVRRWQARSRKNSIVPGINMGNLRLWQAILQVPGTQGYITSKQNSQYSIQKERGSRPFLSIWKKYFL